MSSITLKSLLESLPKEDHARLMHAFNHELTQFVSLPSGMYLGVNTKHIRHLEPKIEAGAWAYGKDNREGQVE